MYVMLYNQNIFRQQDMFDPVLIKHTWLCRRLAISRLDPNAVDSHLGNMGWLKFPGVWAWMDNKTHCVVYFYSCLQSNGSLSINSYLSWTSMNYYISQFGVRLILYIHRSLNFGFATLLIKGYLITCIWGYFFCKINNVNQFETLV